MCEHLEILASVNWEKNRNTALHGCISALSTLDYHGQKDYFAVRNMQPKKLPRLKSTFSVDCVIFGVDDGVLKILLIERNEPPFKAWKAIPGNLVRDQEDIDDAAKRILYELTGLKDIYL